MAEIIFLPLPTSVSIPGASEPIPLHAHSFRHFEAMAESQSAAMRHAKTFHSAEVAGRSEGDLRSNLPSLFPLSSPPPLFSTPNSLQIGGARTRKVEMENTFAVGAQFCVGECLCSPKISARHKNLTCAQFV